MMAGLPPFYDTNVEVSVGGVGYIGSVCVITRVALPPPLADLLLLRWYYDMPLPPFPPTQLMYEKIMTAELRFPKHFLPETRSLLAGMLTRNVVQRLGYGGTEEVRAGQCNSGFIFVYIRVSDDLTWYMIFIW